MGEIISSGQIVELILAFMVLEAGALFGWRHLTGKGLAIMDIVALLLPGVFLLLALRGALVGAPSSLIAVFLAAALFTHAGDLWRRHRQH